MHLADSAYGKARIRLLKVRPGDGPGGRGSSVADLTVHVDLHGDLEAAYTDGDNSRVLPTDTMRNTVYAIAAERGVDEPDTFAAALARHFLDGPAPLERAGVTVEQRPWRRATVDGGDHPHAFVGGPDERRTAAVTATTDGVAHTAGLYGLDLLKTTGSAFEDFLRDEWTTLADAPDRVLQTAVTAHWPYTEPVAWDETWEDVRATLIEVFATHDDSRSVQHTLWAMGTTVLDRQPAIGEISLSLPNRHNLAVDLPSLGLEPDPTVLMPVDEPSGVIEATVTRD